MSRALALALCLASLSFSVASAARAAPPDPANEAIPQLQLSSPYSPFVRQHFYQVLSRSPAKAFLWELLLPGAGHVYTGFPVQAVVAAGLSCLGAGLWIAGAVRDQHALWWAGALTFGAGRAYGLVSAPVTAALLNAAYRRQLGITDPY